MQEDIVMKSGERITEVIAATLTDRLGGELVLDFRTAMKRHSAPKVGDRLTFLSQVFTITAVNRTISNGAFLMDISAEQASFSLADEEFDLKEFNYSGSASGALSRILSGTDFTGAVDSAVNSSVVFEREGTVNRRTLLNDLCGMIGGELVYDGEGIRIAAHRGSTNRYVINREYAVSDFSVSERGDGVSYEMVTDRLGNISVGDDVTISLTEPFSVQADVRVIGIRYNPFYRKSVVIEMGDYRPDITDEMVDDREEAENIRDSLKDYVTNDVLGDKVSSSIDTYINSEGGRASLVHSLKGEYVTTDEATGFVEKTELSAEIAAYVDSEAGTAKITQNLSGTFLKEDALGNYVEKTELNTSIGSYIDTSAGTAKIVSAASGTFQKKSDMGSYVTTTTLNTSIGQYIDSTSGTAKIISACSGTYVKDSDLTGYAKTTAVTAVEQSVSSVESKISLTASYGSGTIGSNVRALLQLVSNADSSSIKIKADAVEIDGTVYLKASDYLAAGTTMIKGSKIQTSELRFQQLMTTSGDYVIDYYASNICIGGGASSRGSFADCNYVDIMFKNGCRFGYANIIGGIYYEGGGIRFRADSGTDMVYIGSSTYPIDSIYCDALYVNGKNITGSDSSGSLSETDISKLYASSTRYLQLNSSYDLVPSYSGFSLGSTTYPFDELYIGTMSYYWKFTNTAIVPNSTSTLYFNIGSSTYPANKVYVRELYINGTKLDTGSSGSGGGSLAGSQVTMGGSTTYYIVADTNRALRPSSTSTLYEFKLGTADYYWHYAYIGSTASYIGKTTSSKLGFFGTTPVARQTVSSSATVATLITALKAYGLIG